MKHLLTAIMISVLTISAIAQSDTVIVPQGYDVLIIKKTDTEIQVTNNVPPAKNEITRLKNHMSIGTSLSMSHDWIRGKYNTSSLTNWAFYQLIPSVDILLGSRHMKVGTSIGFDEIKAVIQMGSYFNFNIEGGYNLANRGPTVGLKLGGTIPLNKKQSLLLSIHSGASLMFPADLFKDLVYRITFVELCFKYNFARK